MADIKVSAEVLRLWFCRINKIQLKAVLTTFYGEEKLNDT